MGIRTFLAGAAFAVLATAASAQTGSTTVTQRTATTTTKPVLGPSKATVNTSTHASAAKVDARGNTATATTKTGKSVTYDCSKAGNKNKAACKSLKKS